MKPIQLDKGLEISLMKAILLGLCSPTLLTSSELSKDGRICLKVAQHLLRKGSGTPLSTDIVSLTATQVYGSDQETLSPYLADLNKISIGSDAQAIIKIASEKVALTNIISMAGSQLISGVTNLEAIREITDDNADKELGNREDALQPFCAHAANGEWKDPPKGWNVLSLPKLTAITRGVMGIWVIAGKPGLGKSTLAWQIALEVGQQAPVLYYDQDGTGEGWFVERTRSIFLDNLKDFKEATQQVYFRPDIGSLERDLAQVPPPALIVVDMVQTLPTRVNYRKTELDQWLVDFKTLSQEGYSFLLISKVPRWMYDKPGLEAFKETGDLEYMGSMCAQLIGDPTDVWKPVEFHLLKFRHGPMKDVVIDITRNKDKIYWFEEET